MANLSSWTRCLVETVERDAKTYDLILTGVEDANGEKNTIKKFCCRLKEAWSNCRIKANEVVSLKAIWNADNNCFCVTNAGGFVVIKPDMLISGTTVVSGLFCIRKAVLSDRFSGIESGNKIVSFVVEPTRVLTNDFVCSIQDDCWLDNPRTTANRPSAEDNFNG